MCLSVKLHLCRLLFIQYKITWIIRIHSCRLVEYIRAGLYVLIIKFYF